MSVKFVTGNIFDYLTKVEAIVNPVNCVGVAGAGLAKQFKQRFPDWFNHYKDACKFGKLEPGGHLTYYVPFNGVENIKVQFILSVATKNHYRNKSDFLTIKNCVRRVNWFCRDYKISSIAVPALGCGLGGFKFETFQSFATSIFINKGTDFYVFNTRSE